MAMSEPPALLPILYHVPRTISSPIVQCLFELELIGTHVVVQELTFAELKSPEHLARNPMGTSPTLVDGDSIVWESSAILDYLLDHFDTEHRLTPRSSDRPARARYLQLKQYLLVTVYPMICQLFLQQLQPEQDERFVALTKEKWHAVVAPTLCQWLGDRPYFGGDDVSAVDLIVGKPLNNAAALGLLNCHKPLQDLWTRLQSRPSFVYAYQSQTEAASPSPSLATATHKHADHSPLRMVRGAPALQQSRSR